MGSHSSTYHPHTNHTYLSSPAAGDTMVATVTLQKLKDFKPPNRVVFIDHFRHVCTSRSIHNTTQLAVWSWSHPSDMGVNRFCTGQGLCHRINDLRLWSRADHKPNRYCRHVSINKIWRQIAVTHEDKDDQTSGWNQQQLQNSANVNVNVNDNVNIDLLFIYLLFFM